MMLGGEPLRGINRFRCVDGILRLDVFYGPGYETCAAAPANLNWSFPLTTITWDSNCYLPGDLQGNLYIHGAIDCCTDPVEDDDGGGEEPSEISQVDEGCRIDGECMCGELEFERMCKSCSECCYEPGKGCKCGIEDGLCRGCYCPEPSADLFLVEGLDIPVNYILLSLFTSKA